MVYFKYGRCHPEPPMSPAVYGMLLEKCRPSRDEIMTLHGTGTFFCPDNTMQLLNLVTVLLYMPCIQLHKTFNMDSLSKYALFHYTLLLNPIYSCHINTLFLNVMCRSVYQRHWGQVDSKLLIMLLLFLKKLIKDSHMAIN